MTINLQKISLTVEARDRQQEDPLQLMLLAVLVFNLSVHKTSSFRPDVSKSLLDSNINVWSGFSSMQISKSASSFFLGSGN